VPQPASVCIAVTKKSVQLNTVYVFIPRWVPQLLLQPHWARQALFDFSCRHRRQHNHGSHNARIQSTGLLPALKLVPAATNNRK
jgi:hypothetical protein